MLTPPLLRPQGRALESRLHGPPLGPPEPSTQPSSPRVQTPAALPPAPPHGCTRGPSSDSHSSVMTDGPSIKPPPFATRTTTPRSLGSWPAPRLRPRPVPTCSLSRIHQSAHPGMWCQESPALVRGPHGRPNHTSVHWAAPGCAVGACERVLGAEAELPVKLSSQKRWSHVPQQRAPATPHPGDASPRWPLCLPRPSRHHRLPADEAPTARRGRSVPPSTPTRPGCGQGGDGVMPSATRGHMTSPQAGGTHSLCRSDWAAGGGGQRSAVRASHADRGRGRPGNLWPVRGQGPPSGCERPNVWGQVTADK